MFLDLISDQKYYIFIKRNVIIVTTSLQKINIFCQLFKI